MDISSSSTNISANSVLHIHVYHGIEIFSKFEFKKHSYNLIEEIPIDKKDDINYYSLRIALESLNL